VRGSTKGSITATPDLYYNTPVERYRERISGSKRYHEFKSRVVSRASKQLVLLVEQREED